MKRLLFFFCLFLASSSSFGQDSEFQRKGRFLVETGSGLISSFGGGTGFQFVVNEYGDNLTNFNFQGGYFVSENLALKAQYGNFSGDGISFQSFQFGAKYYLLGRIPLNGTLGSIRSNSSTFVANFSAGYGIKLADNIFLEPAIGILYADSPLLELSWSFSMFL